MRFYISRLSGFPLITALILLSVFLTACGGGEPAATTVPTDAPATQVVPATEPSAPATVAPAPTTPPVVATSPGAGAATPVQATVSPTGTPTTAPTVAPTEAPSALLGAGAVKVLRRSCPEDFRQMLLGYDGVEEFGAEVVRKLSDEFVGVRPDCLAQGWDPEFPTDPEVCISGNSLSSSRSYKKNRRSNETFLETTSRVDESSSFERGGFTVRLQVHFTKVPLLSMLPAFMLPVEAGEAVGGCWSYTGHPDGGGRWFESLIKYQSVGIPEGGVLRDLYWLGAHLSESLDYSYPECDRLLQTVMSTQLESGLVLDASAVDDAVDQARLLADGACDQSGILAWNPAPVDSQVGGCPGTPLTGLQDDGSYVVNWGKSHYDGYGVSACWILSADGEWVGYLKPE